MLGRTDIRVKPESANGPSCGLDPTSSQGHAVPLHWLVNEDEFSRVEGARRSEQLLLRSDQLRTEHHWHADWRFDRNHVQLMDGRPDGSAPTQPEPSWSCNGGVGV